MNMAGMNAVAGGGPVGGGNMMMNNTGSPAVANPASNPEQLKLLLNTYIYEYFLKHGHFDIARALVKEEKFDMRTNPKQSPGRRKDGEINGADDSMDMDKDDIPDDLPRPSNISDSGQQSSGFLFEWFAVFSDIFQAHRGQNKMTSMTTPATQYLLQHHQFQRMRENQNQNRPNMMPNQYAGVRNNPVRNGVMNGDLAKQRLTPVQMHMLQQNKTSMQQQAMPRGDQADGDPNVRSGSPADGENGGSPSKRARLDGQPQFNGGMMPNGRPGMPGTAGQQGMMIQAGFAPGMNPQFRPNGGMPPKSMAADMAVANGMMNMANSSSPMMQAMNQFPDGMAPEMFPNRNPGMGPVIQGGPNGQSGNHALQDYQMQLMLLEQQNKKRLMMARQEQHENTNPRDVGPMPGGVNMPPGMSPSGNRTSPNPSEQMKRTPQIGGMPGSPSAGDLQGRSPANMGFMNGMQAQDYGMFMKEGQQMMAPGGPNMRPPVDMNQMNRQRQNGFPGSQAMVQQPSQGQPQPVGTPSQREMPPPSQPPANNSAQRNNQPASPANSSNAPPTPSQGNKPNPKAKKGKDDSNRKRPQKKNSTTNASNSEDNPPATPTPSTPMTPQHANSFNNSAAKGQAPVAPNQANQATQQMQAAQQMQPVDLPNNTFGDFNGSDQNFNLDFSTLENTDVLENFDFDSFLNTSADDAFPFDGSMGAEPFNMDGTGD